MQTSLEITEGLARKLKVTLPSDTFKSKYNSNLSKKAKTAKIDGFRPGKAPIDIVKKYFSETLFENTIHDIISASLPKALEQEKVLPVNTPDLESVNTKENEDFEYIVAFEVEPTIDNIHFDNVTIEKISAQVADEDIERALENIKKQFSEFIAHNDASQLSDRVLIDFAGSINGELFEGGSAKNQTLILGDGKMIPGFEENIVGMKVGDEKVISVTFPNDYHEELAGKAAEFKINVHKVETPKAPEITEDLIKRLGMASGDLNELKAEIKKTLERELNRKLRNDLRKKVLDALLEQNTIDLPKSIVHDEIHVLMDQAKERFAQMTGGKSAPIDLPHEMFEPEAKRRVQCTYLILKVIKDNDLKVDQNLVNTLAEEMAAAYEDADEVKAYYLKTPEHYRHLEQLALEDAVVQYLLNKANINTIEKSYAELMLK